MTVSAANFYLASESDEINAVVNCWNDGAEEVAR